MPEESLTITNTIGLHARPAALLVKTAAEFKSDIVIVKEGRAVNAKSLLSLMGAAVRQGDVIIVRTSGEDEQAALAAITALIRNGFGEK